VSTSLRIKHIRIYVLSLFRLFIDYRHFDSVRTIVYALFAILIFDILLPILTEKYPTIRIRLWTSYTTFRYSHLMISRSKTSLISGNASWKPVTRAWPQKDRHGFVVCFILTAYMSFAMPRNQLHEAAYRRLLSSRMLASLWRYVSLVFSALTERPTRFVL